MSDDDVRVPAGWYPDPLGLPQLRWWNNHAWTEHTSDARQPVVAETVTAPPMRAAQPAQAAASSPLLAFADDLPFADDLADVEDTGFFDGDAPPALVEPTPTGTTDLPSRRTLREAERLAHDDDVVRDLAGDSARFGEPLSALEAPVRAGDAVEADSPAMRYARAARVDDAPRSMRYDLDERHEDLLGETSIPRSAFAHASSGTRTLIPDFPDEPGSADGRYAEVQEETTERVVRTRHAAFAHAPQTTTVPAWILTLLPIYMLLVGMMVLLGGADASFAPVTVALVVGVPWVAGIAISIVDHRMLKRGGMDRPAHWLWSVLGAPVYLIARLVSTVREAGTGFGPVLTYLVLALVMAGAVLAVPGLAMELAPASFSAEAERSVADDGRSLGADLTIDCPETPPLLVQQSFFCTATDEDGETFQVLVSLQRSNGWIDWRVDNWGIFSM